VEVARGVLQERLLLLYVGMFRAFSFGMFIFFLQIIWTAIFGFDVAHDAFHFVFLYVLFRWVNLMGGRRFDAVMLLMVFGEKKRERNFPRPPFPSSCFFPVFLLPYSFGGLFFSLPLPAFSR